MNHEIVAKGLVTEAPAMTITLPGVLVDRQIKVFDGLHPSRLTQIQVEWRADIFEALVIGENLTLIAQQILTSC